MKQHQQDKWESGELGRSEEHAVAADANFAAAVDDSLGLHLISIRLQRDLIQQLKLIAAAHGIGYQPLVRDVLSRFARREIINIAEALKKTTDTLKESESPAAKFFAEKKVAIG